MDGCAPCSGKKWCVVPSPPSPLLSPYILSCCVIPLETSLYLVEYLSILEVTHSGRAGGLDRNEVVDRKLIYSILPTPLRKKILVHAPGHFNKYGMVPRSL